MKNLPSLRQLHALMLISETGSFTRTADLLSVTQSAVSILIRELEAEVGAQLVYRGRTASLTAGGQRLERAARRAWREIEQAQREVREHRENAQAVIRLAVGSLSAATFVPRALAMLEADPQSKLRVGLLDG
ncbi:MAG: LysR family transcriptional regulator, partial [Burkholderiales bacterium]|nr:LysR family transcriptional regulator [Burkholderiales bacterium]